MDQLYEQWLLSQRPGWGEESSSNSVRENGKQIHMPTDYAEEVVSPRAEPLFCFFFFILKRGQPLSPGAGWGLFFFFPPSQAGNHCWLCGKNCNSEKQWQQHITSDKHKERVFNSEDDHNCWQHRFPTGAFRVCER